MNYRSFILSSFFLLFVVISSPPAYAKIGDLSGPKEMKAEGSVEIEADELTYDRETQTYEAHGQVEVSRGDLSLKADHARLNNATKELTAWGNVLLREGEDVVECQRLEVNLDTRLGKMYQAKLYLKDQNFHVAGREIDKLGENHYRVRDASLTTCDAKVPPWKFTVKEIEIEEMALGGWGVAKGPIFYLENIPLLYFPWGIFPVRQERQSGFLIPQAGNSSSTGLEFKSGFYWAPTKDMDATFYLNYLGSRGFKEGLEYRYAFARETKGEAHFYFIDDQDFGRNRYSVFIKHEQKFPYDFYLKGDINRVSDHQYLYDFDTDVPNSAWINVWSARQMRSVLFGGKNWDHFSFLAQGAVYDDLTKESNDHTPQILPQMSFYAHPQSLFKTPFFWDLTSSYTNFWRERGVSAHRGDFFPTISYPVRLFNVLKFESDLGLRETVYNSYNDLTGRFDGWRSRQTLEANVQTSAEFYRVYDAEDSKISNLFNVLKWMHSIEPMVAYAYAPRVNQTHFPNFDAVDHIPYTNEITYGVTQRLLGRGGVASPTAFEYGKLILSQSYSLGKPFIDAEGKRRIFSNIQGEFWWNFGPYITAHWDGQLNPYRGSFDAFNFTIYAKDRRDDALSVQFRDTKGAVPDRGIFIYAKAKTIVPLYLFVAFYYNLLAGSWVQATYGAEYQAQCWSLGFYIDHRNQSPDGTVSRELKFHVYFTLLNIGSYGGRPFLMSM